MEIYALSGVRGLPRGTFATGALRGVGGLQGLGAVDMCSDRATMAQTILTMAGAILATQGGEDSSLDEAGSAITGATLEWTKRCAAAGASAAELQAMQQQIELQKATLAVEAQKIAAQQAKDNAAAKAKQQQFLIGAGILGFLGVAVIMKMK